MQHDDRANLRNKMRVLCHNAEQPNVCYPYHPNGIFHKGNGREGKGNSTNPASPKPVPVHTQSRDNIRGKLVEQGIPPNPGPSSQQDLGPRCGELCGTLCCTNCPHAIAKEDAGLTTHPANPLGKHVQDNKGTNTKRRKRMMPSADHIVKGDYAKFPKDNASNSSKGNMQNGKSNTATKTRNKGEQVSQAFKLIICNVTHLLNNIQLLKGREFTAAAITEHSLPCKEYPELRKQLGQNYKSSGLDPEKGKNVGGTGCVLRSSSMHLIQPKPLHKQMVAPNNQGRAGMYLFEICSGVHCLTYVVYGWTGADTDPQAACRTDDLLCIIHQDMMMQQDGPKLIVGDFNGSLAAFVAFNVIIKSNQLYDIGAMASAFGGINNDVTCKANGKAQATRRDYVIANLQARQMIDAMTVDHKPCFLVHDVIEIVFEKKAPIINRQAVNMPVSLKTVVNKVLDHDYGDQNIKRAQEQQAKKEEEEQGKVFTCEPELAEGELKQTAPVFPTRNKNNPDYLELMEQADKDCEDFIAEAMDNDDAAKYTAAQKHVVYTRLHLLSDKHLDALKGKWERWLASKDTDKFFKNFSKCIEAATIEFGNLQCSKDIYKGRGTVNIREATETISTSCCSDVGGAVAPLTREGERLLKQSRRVTALRNNIHSLHKCKNDGDPNNKVRTLEARIREAIDNIVKDASKNDGLSDVRRGPEVNNFNNIPNYFALTKISEGLSARALKLNKHSVKINKKKSKVDLRHHGAHKNATAAMKGQKPPSMSHLIRPETVGPGKSSHLNLSF